MNSLPESDEHQHTNIKLIYEYTEYRLKLTNDSISALNTKFSAILGFSTTAIVFSINLPNRAFIPPIEPYICYSCLLLKISVCVLLIATIFISVAGYLPKETGGMTPPELLMNENYRDSDEHCRLIITKTWIEALKELEALRDEKAQIANRAILTLSIAALCATLSIILAAGLSMVTP